MISHEIPLIRVFGSRVNCETCVNNRWLRLSGAIRGFDCIWHINASWWGPRWEWVQAQRVCCGRRLRETRTVGRHFLVTSSPHALHASPFFARGGCRQNRAQKAASYSQARRGCTDNNQDKCFSLSASSRLIGVLRMNFTVFCSVDARFPRLIFILIVRRYTDFREK